MAVFHKEGIQFHYPENWKLSPEETEDGWSATVQTADGGAFFLLSVHQSRPDVQTVLDTTLAALREDYPDLETTPAQEKIAGHKTQGVDAEFLSLDFVTSCWLRCWQTPEQTLLVMCQASDLDAEHAEPVLRAMRASVETKSPLSG